MSEEPRENPKLRMDENMKNQKMKRKVFHSFF